MFFMSELEMGEVRVQLGGWIIDGWIVLLQGWEVMYGIVFGFVSLGWVLFVGFSCFFCKIRGCMIVVSFKSFFRF